MYLTLTTDRTNLWWLLALAFLISVGYFLLTAISFKVYKKVKRHFAIQYSISKDKKVQRDIEDERMIVEKGFKTRLYLQIILGLVLHVNLYFVISLIFDLFEWWYIYLCFALGAISMFFTRRAFNIIDHRKARKEFAETAPPE
ncbi:MAG: UbiA family prenyltransferase [Bacteroidetes bacterium]|nr:UbiA family prenyltransferase [Bacteroidota bacterium]